MIQEGYVNENSPKCEEVSIKFFGSKEERTDSMEDNSVEILS